MPHAMSPDPPPPTESNETRAPESGAAHGPSATAEGNRVEQPDTGAAQVELAATHEKLLRAMADGENLRRQMRREQDDARRFAIADFALDLLATADTLELALEHLSDAQRSNPALAPLVEGVEATRRMLQAAFSKHGLTRSHPLGEPFDPNVHEAGFHTYGPDDLPDSITQVVRPGYALHGRVLRPALVGMASAAADGAGKP